MLVCNVTLRPKRSAIAADLTETAAALDLPGSGNVVFATLVDDPASVADRVDAFLGQIMREAASATDIITVGLAYAAADVEAATAADMPNATITPAPTGATWNPADFINATFSNANLTITGTATNAGARTTTGHNSGNYYAEFTIGTWVNGNTGPGLATSSATFGAAPTGTVVIIKTGNIVLNGSNTGSTLGSRSAGNIIGIAVNFTSGLIWFRVAPAGNWNGSGTADPATGTGGVSISTLVGSLFLRGGIGAPGDAITGNFGASAFSGSVPSGFTAGWP